MLVTKFSNGKYRNEGELFDEPISSNNVKLMGEMIALQALRTAKKYDWQVADKYYLGLIKDLHHMGEIDYIVSDGYDIAQTAICFLCQFMGKRYLISTAKTAKGLKFQSNLLAIVNLIANSSAAEEKRKKPTASILRTIKLFPWIL